MAREQKTTLRPVSRRREPAQARSRTTVNSILDATETLIEREGIDRITTNKIAEEVGVSVGTLYGYFQNKESVLFALAQRWLDKNTEAVDRGHPKNRTYTNWMEWVDQLLKDVFEVYQKEPGMTLYYDILRFLPELRELDHQHESKMIATMSSALSAFSYRGSEPDLQVDAMMLMLTVHTFLTRAAGSVPEDRSAILQRLRLLVHSMLLPHYV